MEISSEKSREKIKSKKAVSPVVSTVLLIVIVVILAIIIFLWARGFIKEKVEKFDKPIEMICSEVNFRASYIGGKLSIVNRGNVPIYNLNVKKEKPGTSDIISLSRPINLGAGASASESVPVSGDYEKIIIIPVLLGKSGNKNKQYTCPENNGVEIEL